MDNRLLLTPRSLDDVEIVSRTEIGRGWGRLERFQIRHKRFDGTWSGSINRDVYSISEVSMVLPYDPDLDAILLIEQFRACGLIYGEASWMIETVAGMKPADETPEDVARREAIEEAGCELQRLTPISRVYASPGGHAERTYMFVGLADLSRIGGIHGLAEEDEDIRAIVVPLDEALEACNDGRIIDAKTMLMIHWLKLNKQKVL